MRIMEGRKIVVLGADLIKRGICEVAAKGGYEVSLEDTELYYDWIEK